MKERPLNFNQNNDQTIVNYNDAKHKEVLNHINELVSTGAYMRELLTDGKLTEGFKETLLACLENYTKDVCVTMGYDSVIEREKKERYSEIRELNTDNRELRRQLGEKVSNEDAREKMKNMCDAVRKWWQTNGFGFLKDDVFIGNGYYKATFSGWLTHRDTTDDLSSKQKSEKFAKMGFDISEGEKADYSSDRHILDTDNNKRLLKKMLKEKYPSLEILEYRSHAWRNKDNGIAQICDIEIMIYDLNDIKY